MTPEPLPDAELDVLCCLWQHGESTARAVREGLEATRPLAHASVMTLLGRLEEKGYVRRRKGPIGKAFLYRAAHRPGGTQRRLVKDLVRRVFGGSGVALVASLFQSQAPTRAEVEELQKLLDDLKKGAS